MATEFKLELDIKDLTKSIDALGSIGSQLDSVVKKIKDAQAKVAAENMGGLTKLVNAVKRKQKELADAFAGTKLGKAMKQFNDSLKTAGRLIQKGVVQPLGKALSVARNLGLALMGAATAAIYFSKGTIQATTESKDAGFRSLNEKKAMEFANNTTGRNLDPTTFNESVLSNTKAWDAFGRLGVEKTKYVDLVKNKGGAAGLVEFVKEITGLMQSGKWDTLTGGIQDHIIEALSEVMGGMSQGMALSFFKNNGYGSSTDWTNKFAEGKGIWAGASFEGMYKTELATEELSAQFSLLKNTLVELFTPHLSNAIKGIAEGFKRLHKWLGSEEGKAAMERFKDGLTKLSVILKDLLVGAFAAIVKVAHNTKLLNLDDGTLEWIDSLIPQKRTNYEKDNKRIRESASFTEAVSGRLAAANYADAQDIASDAKHILALHKDKIPADVQAKLQQLTKFNDKAAYVNQKFYNQQVDEAQKLLQEVKITINNNTDSKIDVVKNTSAGAKR